MLATGWLLTQPTIAWSQTSVPVQISTIADDPTVTPFVFVVGYDQLDENSQLLPSVAPIEVHVAGQWVRQWPLDTQLPLSAGLHYRAVRGLQDQPSPGQPASPFVLYTGEKKRLTFQLPVVEESSLPATSHRSKRSVEVFIVHDGRMEEDHTVQLMVADAAQFHAQGDSVFQGGLDLKVESVGQVLVGHADLEPGSIVLPVIIQQSTSPAQPNIERGIPNRYDGGDDLILRFTPLAPSEPASSTLLLDSTPQNTIVPDTPRPQAIHSDAPAVRWKWLALAGGLLGVLAIAVRLRAKT